MKWETKVQFSGMPKTFYLYRGKEVLLAKKSAMNFARLNCVNIDIIKAPPGELELSGSTESKFIKIFITVKKIEE